MSEPRKMTDEELQACRDMIVGAMLEGALQQFDGNPLMLIGQFMPEIGDENMLAVSKIIKEAVAKKDETEKILTGFTEECGLKP